MTKPHLEIASPAPNPTPTFGSRTPSILDGSLRSMAKAWVQSRIGSIACGITDQGMAAGAIFLGNVVLARIQSKEEYGLFVLSYSVYTFLSGLHNAAILEAYTVYGSGKYSHHFREYLKVMLSSNVIACLSLMVLLGLGLVALLAIAPHLVSKAMLGLMLTVGVLLSAAFLRRTFYMLRQPYRAACMSLVFISAVCGGLWLTVRMGWLNSFSLFIVFAIGWIIAGLTIGRPLILKEASGNFTNLQPNHWEQHWKYARWVLATSFVFQLMTQGYYWLVAGALSVKGVAELRAMYILVNPTDQIFIALSFLVLPRLAHHYASKRRDQFLSLWKRFALFTFLVTVSLFFGIRVLGAPLVYWLYAGKFDNALSLLYVLAGVPIVMGIGNTMNDALKSMERPHVVFYAYLASGAMTFAVGLPLVKHLGVQGAVIGMLLSAAAYTSLLAVGFFYAVLGKPFGMARTQDVLAFYPTLAVGDEDRARSPQNREE